MNRFDAVNTGAIGFRKGWKSAFCLMKRKLDSKANKYWKIEEIENFINQELSEIREAEKEMV